jgi:alanyl-tRNA synthetase
MSQLTPQFLAQKAWDLYQTHGVPFEVSEDILEQNELKLDQDFLNKLIEEHQSLSRTTSAGQFKSGLGEQTDKTKKLHTATHILHGVLRKFFGDETKQMGSAITNEKARFDFSLDRSFTPQELDQIEAEVQNLVDLKLHMNKIETTEKEAREMGAIGLFGEKYGDKVSVYSLQDEIGKVYSREFCGGPHVTNSSEIGKFKILKQKSVGQGIRRLEFDVE